MGVYNFHAAICMYIYMYVDVHVTSYILSFNSSDDAFVTKLVSTSPTSVTITLTLADGVNATNYSISYSNTNTQCFTDSNDISGITASTTVYTLTGLQEATEYSIIVTAILSDGRIEVARQLATTEIAG